MSPDSRPLSPHLQIYRLPLTALLSIAHRISGASLGLAALAIAILFITAAIGESAYAVAHSIFASGPGRVLVWLFVYGFNFHLCNGVRHLVWDGGYALDLKSVDRGAMLVLVVSAVLTIIVMAVSASMRGGL